MKKIIFFFYCLLASSLISAQTERIVCNAPNYNNGVTNTLVYNNLQTCLDAANAGDIIYVHGSAISHGDIVVRKRVTLIGPGYFLAENPAPTTQAAIGSAVLNNITFKSAGSNSLLKGFHINSNVICDSASNIIIQNNYFAGGVHLRSTSNCIIKQNIGGFVHAWWDVWTNNTNLIVSNNIFYGGGTYMNAIIENNIFNCDFSDTDHLSFYGSNVKNNIIGHYSNYYYNSVQNTVLNNNIFRRDIWGIGNSQNIIDGNTSNYFVGTGSTDGRFKLKAGSPATSAGAGGVDCGAFGGSEPYKLSGIGFNPNIPVAEVDNTGTTAAGLRVRLRIYANQ